ncbi:MAG: hypothetical protein CM15mP9_6030 [Methanobacteriota archaeon]|nr:MAG: hypothetical protein CM15mP9_6030 [Euryarchaeota archaeon]
MGCADLDGDGVFPKVDNCQTQPSGHRMQTVLQFTNCQFNGKKLDMATVEWIRCSFLPPTLDGKWSFRNEWTKASTFPVQISDPQEIVTMWIGQESRT